MQSTSLFNLGRVQDLFKKQLGESDTFDGHIWSKMRKDPQYLLEEVQDQAIYLEYLQSILAEFDTIYALGEEQLEYIFHDWLGPLIKLRIDELGRRQIS